MYLKKQWKKDLRICASYLKSHGTSYFAATKLFKKKELRQATYALYAFVRVADEYVDNPEEGQTPEQIMARLDEYQELWTHAYEHKDSTDPVLRAASHVFHTYGIPFQYSLDFLAAMKQDVTVSRYASYADLEVYMYGSAAVVGLMMTYVIGYHKDQALVHARQLGEAMQLTNFLRDIREDFAKRDRIYLPQDELTHYGVSEQELYDWQMTPKFKSFMAFQVARARSLYAEAELGIPMLKKDGQFAVLASARLYAAILDKIEAQEYDIFRSRAHTTKKEKLAIIKQAKRELA
jgi:phytoene synthase